MPFGADVFALLEDALAEVFQFHEALDTFLRRSGVSETRLRVARESAEQRSKVSPRNFNRAPKRFVVQELLKALNDGTEDADRLVAGLITALCKTHFPEASPKAATAIETLQTKRLVESREADARREEQRTQERQEERARERRAEERASERAKYRDAFLQLSLQDNPQARGYMLEKFLNEFLTFEGLNPRGSFKLIGEQIDGSFAWAERTYLVEAKWVSKPVGGAGFSNLMYKIEGKTADTRGLFISVNGYSSEAIEGLRKKGELRFVCIDGAHLMRCVEQGGSFVRLLEIIWRHASETGEAYFPVSAAAFQIA